MEYTEITVSSGRTFNHPFEDYSNLRPSVSITAKLDPEVELETQVKQLQEKCEVLVEDHKAMLLGNLQELENARRVQQQMERCQAEIKRMQDQIVQMQETGEPATARLLHHH